MQATRHFVGPSVSILFDLSMSQKQVRVYCLHVGYTCVELVTVSTKIDRLEDKNSNIGSKVIRS